MGVLFLVLLRRVKMILIALVRSQISHGEHGRRFTAAVGVVAALRQLNNPSTPESLESHRSRIIIELTDRTR